MKKKMGYASIGAAVLLILASVSSVIGSTASQSQNQQTASPLFAVRTAQSNQQQQTMNIQCRYLGKGRSATLFPASSLTLQSQLDKAIKIIQNNPGLVKKLLEKISDAPQIIKVFTQYGVSVPDVQRYITQVKDNPELLKDQLKDVDFALKPGPLGPRPLGLDTSSAIGCFITVLVLLPLAIVIGILIATITLVTCLNIGGCAEAIITGILQAIVQELTPP